jgi:REP element-mobilizing transposase RayT
MPTRSRQPKASVPSNDPCSSSPRIEPISLYRPELHAGFHSRGYLPHLKAAGGTYFVTFRLGDSLPRSVRERLSTEREEMAEKARAPEHALTPVEQRRLAWLFSERVDEYLNAGYGHASLAVPEVASMVRNTLLYFDGSRYELHAWIIMPNHVHALVTPRAHHTLSAILHSWKSFSGSEANKILRRRGAVFWQRESYDHLVRDEGSFWRIVEYIRRNPVSARLCPTSDDWPYVSGTHVFLPGARRQDEREA